MKIMTVVGTRPEIIRLSRVMAALDRHLTHIIVHTGQNYDYELNQIFFEELGIRKPDHFLGAAGKSAAETIGLIIAKIDDVLVAEQPDALLVLGDTNSCLAVISAKRRKIPIFHMEAGNRCFDMRVPEEVNRRIVDHTSDINMPYSDIARDYLLREGLAPDRIVKTGSPMFEVLNHYRADIEKSGILGKLALSENGYFVVSAHREENIDLPGRAALLAKMLNQLAEDTGQRVIVSAHPRSRKRFETEKLAFHPGVELMKPLGFFDYVHLQMKARAVLSDSGTISEESAILNFPAINIRDAHERPEAMEEGVVMFTGLDYAQVKLALGIVGTQGRGKERTLRLPDDYSMPNVSEKVVRIIVSYTSYVNRTVWSK